MERVCSLGECNGKHYGRGFCKKHYDRWRANGNPNVVRSKRRKFDDSVCTVVGCGRKQHCRELCASHYERFLKGKPLDDIRQIGHFKTKDGYVRKIYDERGPIPEHRWVYEQYLGRRLLKSENVHHINGIKSDNRFENLELWSKNQPTGTRVRDKIKWAKEILEIYGDDEDKF